MYHGRMTGTHYEAGLAWGRLLARNGKKLDSCPTFQVTGEVYEFAARCRVEYERYFPEILEEIRGIADGNGAEEAFLQAVLFGMYCFSFDNKCTCFAFRTEDEIVFGRNSDFLVSLEKLYMNCIYRLNGSYRFQGNTTKYVEMEDGVNEKGLAAGLTFVYPRIRKPGFNAGMLIRYLLEKCATVKEAIGELSRIPLASAQTITLADREGNVAVVECNPKHIAVILPEPGERFVAAVNNFHSDVLVSYQNPEIDDWRSEERYHTVCEALKGKSENYSVDYAKSVLAGKYGFLCQYDRKHNADTVWSVVYDLKRRQIWRVEGNPSRKQFRADDRILL